MFIAIGIFINSNESTVSGLEKRVDNTRDVIYKWYTKKHLIWKNETKCLSRQTVVVFCVSKIK